MKYFRNPYVLSGVGLIIVGIAVICSVLFFRHPPKEISRSELEQIIATKTLVDGRLTPTPYTGVYELEGKRQVGQQTQRIFISTHLDEGQVKGLLAQTGAKLEIPGQSVRGQWLSIVSTLII